MSFSSLNSTQQLHPLFFFLTNLNQRLLLPPLLPVVSFHLKFSTVQLPYFKSTVVHGLPLVPNSIHLPFSLKHLPSFVSFKTTLSSVSSMSLLPDTPPSSTSSHNLIQEPPTMPTSLSCESSTTNETEPKSNRLGPKRQVAILMGYCGKGYQGMQTNQNAKTIEGILFQALIDLGCVSKENAIDQKKIGFQRAARTDKGVHALGQVVNAKLVLHHVESNLVQQLNEKLPQDIRIWDVIRVRKSFDSKLACDSRKYSYLLPTYVFAPLLDWSDRLRSALSSASSSSSSTTTTTLPTPGMSPIIDRSYRLPKEAFEKVTQFWHSFQGTHSFHNFTIQKTHKDANAKRYMIQCEVDPPHYVNDLKGEWMCFHVHGQSFMYHQIRKMIGLVIFAMKTNTSLAHFQALIATKKTIKIPKAPGVGLWLNQCCFHTYNRKSLNNTNSMKTNTLRKKIKEKEEKEEEEKEEEEQVLYSNASKKLKLDLDLNEEKEKKEENNSTLTETSEPFPRPLIDFSKYEKERNAFKLKFIGESIFIEEVETQCYQAWLDLVLMSPQILNYFNSEEIIPDPAPYVHRTHEKIEGSTTSLTTLESKEKEDIASHP